MNAAGAPDPAPTAAPGLHADDGLTLIKGGDGLFPALAEAIGAARSEVLLETYIFAFDRSVLPVAQALADAAQRGVRVRVVVDGIGTGALPAEWAQRWKRAGVQWQVFNPARGWRVLVPRRWRRLHRKLCVVDAAVGFCGGINLLDDHFDPNHGELAQPRLDFAVRVTGALVSDIRDTMTRLWSRLQVVRGARHGDLPATVQAAKAVARAGTEREEATRKVPPGARAMLVLRDNFRYRRRIESTYRLAIAQARSEILIANAYFIPGVRLQQSLLRAARRGVRITLLLQGRYEYFMQYHASRAVYGPLLDAGIEIIEYAPSFLHAKVAVMDSTHGAALATVGSSNLDPLSLLLAREANVFVRDDVFAAELRAQLLDAIANQGVRIQATEHMNRPWRTRVLNWVAYALMRTALLLTGKRY